MSQSEAVELTLFFHAETEKALLLSDDGSRKVWVPKSCIRYDKVDLVGETPEIELEMDTWMAEEKEFI